MTVLVENAIQNQILDVIENEFIITKADPKGRIIYANDLFCKISGYTREELIGKPHNIVRHPDMPKSVFKDLWDTIKVQKKPWVGLVKNKKKDGGFYWVSATVFPIFDPNNPTEILEYISIRKEITNVMIGYEKDQFYSKLYEILNFYYTSNDLKTILNFALEKVLQLPWLEILGKGGIMLWNSEKEKLEMFVYKGVGQSLLDMCHTVPSGRCLCGRAALRKELVFKSCVDEEHENRPQGMTPHGHYNVPLMFNGELQGVLFLYVEHEHIKKDIEVEFLNLLGNVLGSIIYKFNLQRKLEILNRENLLILENLKTYSSKETYEYTKMMIQLSKIRQEKHKQITKQKTLYLMFLDIVNFTGFSENKTPEEVVIIVNLLFSKIIDTIYKNKGDIDKFIGDAIFAYFDDPDQCLKAGLEILNALFSVEYNPHNLQIRIGIHCGEVIQTNLGNEYRRDFTLMGDTVNTTQRIQSAAKPNSILVSEAFMKKASSELLKNFQVSKKLLLKAKNKSNPIDVYILEHCKNLIELTA